MTAAALLLLLAPLATDARELGAQFLSRALSVRQAGMAGVSLAATDALSGWSNPALLAAPGTGFEAAANGGSLLGGGLSAAGLGLRGRLAEGWTAGGGLARFASAAQEEIDELGDPTGRSLAHTGIAAGAGAAGSWAGLGIGVLIKGAWEDLAGDARTLVAADAGITAEPGGFFAGAALRNLGPAGTGGLAPPRELRAGLGTGRRLARLRLAAGVDYVRTEGRDGGIGAGAEWWPARMLAVRAGARDDARLSAGVTAVLDELSVDYGFASHPAGAAHVVGVSWRTRWTARPAVRAAPAAPPIAAAAAPATVFAFPFRLAPAPLLPVVVVPLAGFLRSGDAPPRAWSLEVRDVLSRIARRAEGRESRPPAAFEWDGRDERGDPVPDGALARIVLSATAADGTVTTRTYPASVVSAEPRLKAGAAGARHAEVVFTLPPAAYQCWRLEVRSGAEPIASWEGAGAPDPVIAWEGRRPDGTIVEGADLRYAWEFFAEDGLRTAGEAAVPTVAARVEPGEGRDRITFPGLELPRPGERLSAAQWTALDKAARLVARDKANRLVIRGVPPAQAEPALGVLFNRYHACGDRVTLEPSDGPPEVAVEVRTP